MQHTKETIKNLLNTSSLAVERAIIAVYARQTMDEQSSEQTSHDNGVGFSGVDAGILSSFAKQIHENKYSRSMGHRLSPKQLEIARKKMLRYTRQLLEIAEEKASVKKVEVPSVEPTVQEWLAQFGNKAFSVWSGETLSWNLAEGVTASQFVTCFLDTLEGVQFSSEQKFDGTMKITVTNTWNGVSTITLIKAE